MAKDLEYKIKLTGEVSDLQTKLGNVKESLSKLTQNGANPDLTKIFNNLAKKIDDIQTKINAPVSQKSAFTALQKDIAAIDTQCAGLIRQLNELAIASDQSKMKMLSPETKKNYTDAKAAIDAYAKATAAATKKNDELRTAEKMLSDAQKRRADQAEKLKLAELTQSQARKDRAASRGEIQKLAGTNDLAAAESQLKRLTKQATEAAEKLKQVEDIYKEAGRGTTRPKPFTDAEGNQYDLKATRDQATVLAEQADQLDRAIKVYKNADSALASSSNAIEDWRRKLIASDAAVTNHEKAVKGATAAWNSLRDDKITAAFNQLKKVLSDIGVSLEGITGSGTEEEIDALSNALANFLVSVLEPVNREIKDTTQSTEELADANKRAASGAERETEAFERENEALKNTEAIKARIGAFVGLNGIMQLVRRTMTDSFNTVKELDAQMAQMAVVTKLDIGDYWAQLPDYTKRANDLGVAIKSVYEAATLYYQQGLNTQQVDAVTTETLKMARIAGLDAAEATNKMTAALRGFNMEVNETNAQRVSDVYSQLAAITASDVEEISTAMTKTASLASNAGMEFETTAAFLSQIIETTRESAETAGTALKTVIARFQELKKSPNEISEIDGEQIDANKIDAALRSVGVSLRDTAGQFRDLDQVFLELSSKWDSLDTNTQRYIATIAAGSRQQSRFIAMMSNYQRTQELVDAAQQSAGASARQYEKTLESLATALTRLSNAWDQFVLSIEDSTIIKGVVNSLTALLSALNKLDKLGKFGGFLKLGASIAGLKAAGSILDKFSLNVQNKMGIVSSAVNALGAPFEKIGTKIRNFVKNQQLSTLLQNSADAANLTKESFDQLKKECLNWGKVLGATSEQLDLFDKATKATNDLTGASILLRNADAAAAYKDAIATGKSAEEALLAAKAKDAENKAQSRSLLVKAKDLILLLFGNKRKRAEVLGRIANASAIKAETAAQSTLNAVMAACPIGWILAGLVAIGAAIYGIVKLIEYNSAEAALERMQEAANAAADAADTAATAYTNLKDSLSSLEEQTAALDGLREGTVEWNDALTKANSTILELIEQYPELAKLLKVDTNGLLSFADASAVEAVLRQYQAASMMAKNAQLGLQLALTRQQSVVGRGATGELARADYNNKKAIQAAQESAYLTAIRSNLISGLDRATYSKQDWSNLSNIYSDSYQKALIDSFKTGDTGDQFKSVLRDYVESIGGTDITFGALGKVKYVTVEGENAEITSKSALNIYATEMASRSMQRGYSAYSSVLAGMDTTTTTMFRNLFAGVQGGGLTKAGLDQWQEAIESGLEKVWENNPSLNELYESAELFEQAVHEFVETADKDFAKANTNLGAYAGSITWADNITSAGARALSEQYRTAIQASGGQAVIDFNNYLNSFLSTSGLTAEEQQTFISQLGALDWSNIDAVRAFSETLTNLNIDLPTRAITEFEDELIKVAHSIKQINLEKLSETISDISQLLDSLHAGTTGRTISSELYSTLVSQYGFSSSDFAKTMSGEYNYLGDSIRDLIKALQTNTASLLATSEDQTAAKLGAASIAEGVVAANPALFGENLDKWSSWTAGKQRGYLAQFINSATTAGINLEDLGIAGLTNETNANRAANVSSSDVTRILGEIVKIVNSQEAITEEQEKYTRSLTAISAESDYTTRNSILATEARERGDWSQSLGYSDAILAQAITMGMDQTSIDNYQKAVNRVNEALANQEEISTADRVALEKYERVLVNAAQRKEVLEGFASLANELDELNQKYLISTDSANQLYYVQQMVGRMGITVTNETMTQYGSLIESMLSGNYDAYKMLMQEAAESAGIGAARLEEIQTTSEYRMSQSEKAWADQMVDLNLGMWVEMSNGVRQFQLLSELVFDDILEDAGKIKVWENPYDWLYDINQRINAEIRQRTLLERQYGYAVEDSQKNVKDLYDLSTKELSVLEAQAKNEQTKVLGTATEIQKLLAANTQFSDLISYSAESGITIDYVKASRITNEDTGKEFEAIVSRLETLQSEMQGAQDNLYDIYDEMKAISERGRQEYLDMEQSVKDALLNHYTKQIDTLEEINNSINDANAKLIDSLQSNIDKMRQDRQNEKTETELANKQRRLAYLSMDTSGANAGTILSLQKELTEGQESYTDSLVDQAISQLQEDNQKAEEQRAEQIEIMRSQLSYADEAGKLWASVNQLLTDGLNGDTGILRGSKMAQLLKENASWTSLSELQKKNWDAELDEQGKLASLFKNTDLSSRANSAAYEAKRTADAMVELGNSVKTQPTAEQWFTTVSSNLNTLAETFKTDYSVNRGGGSAIRVSDAATDGTNTQTKVGSMYFDFSEFGTENLTDFILEALGQKRFASGGLATSTGPAWLDGTRSAPELVLNAQDTRNFLELKDLLASFKESGNTLGSMGDNYYDVDINVDNIDSDYGVEQMATKVRDIIVNDAQYRNVTAINRLR